MSAVRQLLSELQSRGVEITPNGDKLRVKSPPGIITPELRERLTAAKPALLQLLASPVPALAGPHVWIATVDGKRMWVIDPDRCDHPEQLRRLGIKFGAARVQGLARA